MLNMQLYIYIYIYIYVLKFFIIIIIIIIIIANFFSIPQKRLYSEAERFLGVDDTVDIM